MVRFSAPGCSGCGQAVDDVDGGRKERRVAAYTGGVSEGDAQMCFPEAYAAQEDCVGLLLDKVQAEQILDLGPVDLLRPVPLELIQGFREREACAADALREALVLAPGDLALDQALQVVEVSPLLFGGRLCEFMIMGAYIGELQPQQEFLQRVAS